MKTSLEGILEIAEHEGIVPAPYWDSVGVLTYGIGHTAAAGGLNPKDIPLTMPGNSYELNDAIQHAVEVFQKDLKSYEARVNKAIKVPLEQHEFDALVSWDFNTGGALWEHPKTDKPCQLVQQINAGNMSGDGFMGWLRPVEIKKRRVAEQRLFRTGDYDHNGDLIPIWQTNSKGRLIGVMRTMRGAELIARMQKSDPAVAEPWLITFIKNLLRRFK